MRQINQKDFSTYNKFFIQNGNNKTKQNENDDGEREREKDWAHTKT